MLIRTPADFGALIRDHRRRWGLDQRALAKKIGASRQWVVKIEKRKPRAEMGLILRALYVLGVPLSMDDRKAARRDDNVAGADIGRIAENARGKEP